MRGPFFCAISAERETKVGWLVALHCIALILVYDI